MIGFGVLSSTCEILYDKVWFPPAVESTLLSASLKKKMVVHTAMATALCKVLVLGFRVQEPLITS